MLYYPFPLNDSFDIWQNRLSKELLLSPQGQSEEHYQYFDTFDWRFFHHGRCLVWCSKKGETYLHLRLLTDSNSRQSVWLEQNNNQKWDPFAKNLPASPLTKKIRKILGLRALLSIAEIKSTIVGFYKIDKEGKTRLRLYLEEHCVVSGSVAKVCCNRIRVEPLRGYQKSADKVCKKIEQTFGLSSGKEDLYIRAMGAMKRTPGDYSTKLTISLDPMEQVGVAMRRILLHLLDTMDRNQAGILQNLDTEFLHDFRIAIRRTRSALGQIKMVFAPNEQVQYKEKFAWLSTITSPTRDLDVYLLQFPKYQACLPLALQIELEPFKTFLVRRHQIEQKKLTTELNSSAYQKLNNQWRQCLTASATGHSPIEANQPMWQIANQSTWRMVGRVLQKGRAIDWDSPAEKLHDLRKTCKKLRYLMEFFQSLYQQKAIHKAIRILKNLQENLGDFQDLEIQVTTLSQFSEQMELEGLATPRTHLAMGALSQSLYHQMAKVRGKFESCFHAFDQQDNRRLFKVLFHPTMVGGARK